MTEDSTTIRSNIGVGVVKAGWHCGSQPGGSGTAANCTTCYKCDGSTCVTDPAQAKNAKDPQIQENCKTETCDGVGVPNSGDAPKTDTIKYDCKKPGCDGMNPNLAKDPEDGDISESDQKCKKCNKGALVADTAKNNAQCDDGSAVRIFAYCEHQFLPSVNTHFSQL